VYHGIRFPNNPITIPKGGTDSGDKPDVMPVWPFAESGNSLADSASNQTIE